MRDTHKAEYWCNATYDLAPARETAEQFFISQHTVNQYAPGGRLIGQNSYELDIFCTPAEAETSGPDMYTCSRFAWDPHGKPQVTIPSLAGWSYPFEPSSFENNGLDAQGLMWGLPHAKFEGMKDNAGKAVPIDPQYQVYSAFTYFHSFCGSSVVVNEAHRLRKIGDRTSIDTPPESPVNLGSMFLPTSRFVHGKASMEFAALSVVDGNPCAVLRMQEIGGRFTMFIRPMPGLRVKSIGSTRVSATLFLDLKTGWIRHAEATVTDVTKTTMYGIPVELSTIISDIRICAYPQKDYQTRIHNC